MENKKYLSVLTVSKYNRKTVERTKSIPLAHKYMITHVSGLVQALQYKVVGLS